VAFPHGCSYRRRLMEWLAEGSASPERILDLGSYHAIVACVAAGTGVAVVPVEVLDQAVLGASVDRHPLPMWLRRRCGCAGTARTSCGRARRARLCARWWTCCPRGNTSVARKTALRHLSSR
jgi:DNA-binding transcriptional LysR family regulator